MQPQPSGPARYWNLEHGIQMYPGGTFMLNRVSGLLVTGSTTLVGSDDWSVYRLQFENKVL